MLGVLVFVFVYFIIIIIYILGVVYCLFWFSFFVVFRSILMIFKIRNLCLLKCRSGIFIIGVVEGEWLYFIIERWFCFFVIIRRG